MNTLKLIIRVMRRWYRELLRLLELELLFEIFNDEDGIKSKTNRHVNKRKRRKNIMLTNELEPGDIVSLWDLMETLMAIPVTVPARLEHYESCLLDDPMNKLNFKKVKYAVENKLFLQAVNNIKNKGVLVEIQPIRGQAIIKVAPCFIVVENGERAVKNLCGTANVPHLKIVREVKKFGNKSKVIW